MYILQSKLAMAKLRPNLPEALIHALTLHEHCEKWAFQNMLFEKCCFSLKLGELCQ